MTLARRALGAVLDQVEATQDDSSDDALASHIGEPDPDALRCTDALAPSELMVVQVGDWTKDKCDAKHFVDSCSMMTDTVRCSTNCPMAYNSCDSDNTVGLAKTPSIFSFRAFTKNSAERLRGRSASPTPNRIPADELCEALQGALRMFVPSPSKRKFVKCRSTVMERSWTFAGYHVKTSRAIRQHFGISDAEFRESVVDTALKEVGRMRSGKSGAMFWFSADNKYVIKFITRSERKTLSAIISKYARYIKSVGKTLLPAICAAFKVACRGWDARFMVMNNVFDCPNGLDQRFDLKGTTEDRYVKGLAEHATGKDLNFGDRRLHLSPYTQDLLVSVLSSDIEWLRAAGIMDYSLLLGIRFMRAGESLPEPASCRPTTLHARFQECQGGVMSYSQEEGCCVLYVGIIDVLQMYTMKKKAARAIKKYTIGCVREIDTEPPSYYASRIVRYLTSKIVVVEEAEILAAMEDHRRAGKALEAARCKQEEEDLVVPGDDHPESLPTLQAGGVLRLDDVALCERDGGYDSEACMHL